MKMQTHKHTAKELCTDYGAQQLIGHRFNLWTHTASVWTYSETV